MTWKDVLTYFPHFKLVYQGKLEKIHNLQVSRTGLEFAGFVAKRKLQRIVLWGKQEFLYLLQFSNSEIEAKLEKIFQLNPPLIVLSRSFQPLPLLLQIAQKYQISIISTQESSKNLTYNINTFLTETLAQSEYIHANLIECYGVGVLIKGESGIGKSEACLELIKKGHLFVGDDAIVCKNVYNKIIGQAPDKFYNFMEVRGLGLINVARVFGIEKIKQKCYVQLIIELAPFDTQKYVYDRLGNHLQYQTILGVKLPYFLMCVNPSKKISDLIEVTVAQLKLIESGYSAYQELDAKLKTKNNE